jgi:hypothetical protein
MPSPSLTGCMDDDVGTGATRLGSAVPTHTPGPWEVGTKGNGAPGYVYCTNDLGSAVAIVYGKALCFSVFSRAEEEANARLIAAAPDLYEALAELADLMQLVIDGEYKPDSFTLQPALAALSQVSDSERSSNVITNEVQS